MTHNPEYYIMDSRESRLAVLDYMDSVEGPMAVDTETTDLDATTCKLLGISLSVKSGEAFYLVTNNITNDDELFEFRAKLISVLENSKRKIIMHNSAFDIIVLRNNMGVDCNKQLFADTILMKHTVDEQRPHDLKRTAVKYLGEEWDQAQKDLAESVKANGGKWTIQEKNFDKADIHILGKYACADADMTIQLFYVFEKMLKDQGLRKFLYDDEVMPLTPVVLCMQERGVKVDLKYYKKLAKQLQKEMIDLEESVHFEVKESYSKAYKALEKTILDKEAPITKTGAFFKKFFESEGFPAVYNDKGAPTFTKKVIEETLVDNPDSKILQWRLFKIDDSQFLRAEKDKIYEVRVKLAIENRKKRRKKDTGGGRFAINIGSNDDIANLLFVHLREKPIKVTEKGNPQVDEDVLDMFMNKYPFVKTLIKWRKAKKLLTTYVMAALDKNVDGIIHPSWMQHGTDSGRFACKDPNYQNLPREDTRIKHGIIARDGYSLVGADYSQLEPRIVAHCSNEPALIESYKNGTDLYSQSAVDLRGLDCDPIDVADRYPNDRQDMKTFVLAAFYGAKKWKIAKILDCSIKEAEKILDNLWKTYSQVDRYINRCHGYVISKGEIASETGRKRRMEGLTELRKSRKKKDQRIYHSLLNLSVNYTIQSLAASIVNRAMAALYLRFKKEGLDAHILAQIHDEIVVESREEEAPRVAAIMKEIMENTYTLRVPLVAEPKIAKRMSETK